MVALELVKKALEKAEGAQAWINQSESSEVTYENDKLKHSMFQQETHMGVRVILNGKVGSSHTTDINDIDGVVHRALETAQFGSPAHFSFPGPQDAADVKIFDPLVTNTSLTEMLDMGGEMISIIKDYNPDILVNSGVAKSTTRSEFANSSGIQFVEESTSFWVWVYGELIRGTDILMAGHSSGSRSKNISHSKTAKKAVELFKMAERNVNIRSGRMTVIFPPEGVIVLLLALKLGLNGKNVFMGSSPLKDKLGQKIADEKLSITDNPLIDHAIASGKFDGEGVPHRILPLIDKGVLVNFLYDLDTAGRAGTKSTGHGIGCNPTNIVIAEGDTPVDEMIKNTKEGLMVYDVMGLGQGNAISGEFSVNVQLGFKIENGEIVGRVKDVMLAGNTYDAIKDIVAIGDKAEWVGGSLLSPHIQIGELNVVSKT